MELGKSSRGEAVEAALPSVITRPPPILLHKDIKMAIDSRPATRPLPLEAKKRIGPTAVIKDEVTWGSLATPSIILLWGRLLKELKVLTIAVGVPPLVPAEARICLKDDIPVSVPQYRLAQSESEFVFEEIRRLKDKGIIIPISSQYCAPLVVVRKKGRETTMR